MYLLIYILVLYKRPDTSVKYIQKFKYGFKVFQAISMRAYAINERS